VAVAIAAGAKSARAGSPEETFERGNAAYAAGRYEEAAEAYRTVTRYGIRDPAVEYNLGNAEFRNGSLGRAILHFERARRLDPTDPDIRGNLEHARSLCVDRVDVPEEAAAVGALRALQNRVGPDRQAWAALGVVWVIAALVAWCSARPGGWSAGWGWTLAALVVVLAVCLASWFATYQRLEGRRVAVVLAEVAEVLAGPGHGNPTLFTVHEGLTLEVRAEREEWLQVSLPNGLNGWIALAAVEPV
jgi:tetratricopeptide (TPR) repeat protein